MGEEDLELVSETALIMIGNNNENKKGITMNPTWNPFNFQH